MKRFRLDGDKEALQMKHWFVEKGSGVYFTRQLLVILTMQQCCMVKSSNKERLAVH